MSATLNPGFKQLYLYLTKPTNAIDIDDDSTIGNQQAIDNSVREDLIGLKVWASTQQNFDASQTQPVYDGVFNTTTAIQNLADNTTYYVRYAFISAIDETVYTILPATNPLSEKTLDTNSGFTAYLTHDPIEIVTDELGNNPVFTNNTGTFKVYDNTADVTGNSSFVTYSVVANSATGGVVATINAQGVYTITAITDLTGTITLRATAAQIAGVYVDKILNVAKRRPGQTAPLVTITGTGSYFVEIANGGGKYPGSYTWSATTTNITSPQYTWYFGRTSQGALIPVEGTGAGYTGGVLTGLSLNGSKNEVTIQNSVFNNLTPPQEKLLKVVVTSGVQGTNVNVFDQESIFYLQEGSDALAIDLVNENQTISLDKDGNIISPANILSQILVARGTDLITTNITYAIAAVEYITSNQIQLTSAGAITIPSTAITADSASATFSATITNPNGSITTLTKKLTLNRVRDGQTGSAGLSSVAINLSNDSHPLPIDSSGVVLSYNGAATTGSINLGGINDTANWTWTIDLLSSNLGVGGSSGITASISGSTVTVTNVSANFLSGIVRLKATKTGYIDLYADFSISKIKADIYYIDLSNDIHQLSAAADGTVSDYTGATTTATVKRGGEDDTANWTFSTPIATTGITITTTNNNKTITVNSVTTSFRTGTITFTATSGTKTISETFSLVSILQGQQGQQGQQGNTGTAGLQGIRSITAYRIRGQAEAPLTIAPSNTSGVIAPTDYSLTAPSVTVGQVLWYSFGRYNPNASEVEGIPALTTVWSVPIAASIFQDIRSDNYNGPNPPISTNFGTTGYYFKRDTGELFATSAYLRGQLVTGVSGAQRIEINKTDANKVAIYNDSNELLGYFGGLGTSASPLLNLTPVLGLFGAVYGARTVLPNPAGTIGEAAAYFARTTDSTITSELGSWTTNYGVTVKKGVYGSVNYGYLAQGYLGYSDSSSYSAAGRFYNAQGSTEVSIADSAGHALNIRSGTLRYGSVTISAPPNNNTTYLRADGTWSTVSSLPSGGNAANFLRGDNTWTNILQGDLYVTGEVTAYYSSDISLKTNITRIKNPLDKLLTLGGYNFDWTQDYISKRNNIAGLTKTSDVGIIAQEVEKILPQAVTTREDGMLAVNYYKLIPLIIEAIIELNNKLNRGK